MVNISEVRSKVAALKSKCDSIAKEKSGEDYDKYAVIYMKYPDGSEVQVSDDKFVIDFESYSYDKQLYYSENLFVLFGNFGDTRFCTENVKKINIRGSKPEVSEEEYRFVCNMINELENTELEYDKEKTTSGEKLKPDYAKIALEEESKKLGLTDKTQYPTIQATVDFWSLFVVDYFISKGEFVLENTEAREKLDLFKKNLANIIVKGIENNQELRINCSVDLLDYYYFIPRGGSFDVEKRPLMNALTQSGINVGDFLAYCKDNVGGNMLNRSNGISTITSLLSCDPIFSMEEKHAIDEFTGPIPETIKRKLDYYSYMVVNYARKNNIPLEDNKNICGLSKFLLEAYYYFTPRIVEYLRNGYTPNIDEDKLCEAVLSPQNCDHFEALALRESFDSFFDQPEKQDDAASGYGGKKG